MTAIAPLLVLPLLTATPATSARQDAPAEASKTWTPEELEKVSDAIRADIEAMRGMKFQRPVKVELADRPTFLRYVEKRQELTEPPERRARDEAIAKMLGLIPPDMDLQATIRKILEEQVGGFYDPSSDTFYLMRTFVGDLARIILSHELTHALDDQCFDLDGTLEHLGQQTDVEFAYMAVVEGSGTSAMNQWTVQHLGEIDKKALLDNQDIGTKGLEDAPPFLWKPLIAAYLCGEGFLVRTAGMNMAMKAAKVADIRAAFENPPRSSEQILHPEKYWDPDERDEPRRIEFDTSSLPEGWAVLGEDTLGELYLAAMATPDADRKPFDVSNPFSILGVTFTNKAAEGWGGDRALLLGKGDARLLWLVTVWDTPVDATEFHDAVLPILLPPASDAERPSPFTRRVEPPDEQDQVVVVVSQGLEEGDRYRATWTVSPKPSPEPK